MKNIVLFLLLAVSQVSVAQEESKRSPFTINGYVEAYYSYDFNKPQNNTRPAFVYSHNRHNEVNLNLGFIRGAYNTDNVRANLALMTGTYANANLAAEPGVLKNIYEANAGIKLSSKKNLWVDAGIFSSHIGFESAVGKDCWNVTRSILADNSPYYEAGAKISYTTDNGKWFLSGLILNGWQRIQRVDGNSLPSFGTQITFKPNANVTLNSSTFVGTDKPDSARQMRYFHNFYGLFQITSRFGLTVGFDYGLEEKNPETTSTNTWFSPVLIAKYAASEKVTLALRGEYYDDKNGVIIATGTADGFRTTGVSANVDYQVLPNAVWRLEVRNLKSKDEVFARGGKGPSKTDTFVTTALAISF
ncbi:porin [Chryseolinea lacunae]|uniref:Porin n=1 Tax=Chryseolinea lacunae TaxID=2801331 RepID=A0ABS1KP22_9BACT|nr:porin [Chryseolinea lacunae]MBL0740001.1 porin [Chryseolinea lacunae]